MVGCLLDLRLQSVQFRPIKAWVAAYASMITSEGRTLLSRSTLRRRWQPSWACPSRLATLAALQASSGRCAAAGPGTRLLWHAMPGRCCPCTWLFWTSIQRSLACAAAPQSSDICCARADSRGCPMQEFTHPGCCRSRKGRDVRLMAAAHDSCRRGVLTQVPARRCISTSMCTQQAAWRACRLPASLF